MSIKDKILNKNTAKTSLYAASSIVSLVIKTMGTILLIALTTAVLFSCIFVIYVRENLTTDLSLDPADFSMSLSSVIYYTDPTTGRERELVTLQSTEFRRWVDYENIPTHMIDALIAIEDHRFYRHHGVDWFRTAMAFMNMFLSTRSTFGGSTITQQVIKNLTHEDDITVQRKLVEIFRAIEYERVYDKEEILELYLNLVYFGHGCYGVGAASFYYFGKEVSELSLAESAALIGITNNPSQYSPYASRSSNKTRQEDILYRMNQLRYFDSEEEYRQSVDEELVFVRGDDSDYEMIIYTWFEEAVIRDVIRDIMDKKGYSEPLARRWLFNGGLKIMSTLDIEMQQIVDDLYQNPQLFPVVTGSSAQLQSGVIIADPFTGEIKALSGGVGEKTSNMLLNRATMAKRPPGSSLKPIAAYAPAMDRGILTPSTLYEDSDEVTLSGTTWMPRNANLGYSGIVNVRTAIVRSLNTIPAVVVDQLSPAVSFRFLRDALGFDLHPADENYAPLAAGQLTNGATVREMASGFTMFPNAGMRSELRTYNIIYNDNGTVFLDNSPDSNSVISLETAYWMTDMLHEAVVYGTGSEANLGSMPTAGKTGTSTDMKDRWFVGFTPYYICAVWTGFDMPATMDSSGNPSAQIWRRLMTPIHKDLPVKPFYPQGNYYIRPVEGVKLADYTIRCLDENGAVIQSETRDKNVIEREITVLAPAITGYFLTGDYSITLEITADSSRNIVEFYYMAEIVEIPVETDPVIDDTPVVDYTPEPENRNDPNDGNDDLYYYYDPWEYDDYYNSQDNSDNYWNGYDYEYEYGYD
ncbi:MAG: transglycosylase domain-containing protein [Oscillospiraceae bacterium]|nr:transglycosylase domain-containing protein [Oscillospiraceae bacterium]